MRPATISWFERLFLAALLVGLLPQAANWKETLAKWSPAIILSGLTVLIGLPMLLVLLISRKRSNGAKRALAVFFAIAIPSDVASLFDSSRTSSWRLTMLTVLVMEGAAIALLFSRSARAWLTGKPGSELRRTFE